MDVSWWMMPGSSDSTLRLRYLFAHPLEILPQTLRSPSTHYCQNFQTDPSAAVSCHFHVRWMRPTSTPVHLQRFFFSDQQQNLWVFSAELIHILPDCSRLQTPSGGYSRKLQTTSPKASSSHISLASPAVRSVSNRLI